MSDDVENRIAKLEQELAALKAKEAEGAAVKKPFVMPRYDPTAGFGMPASAVRAMVDAVPDSLMRSIAGDARRKSEPGWLKPETGKPVEKGSGWVKPAPLSGSVPGIDRIDEIAAHFDRLDRRDREK
jgi:hypothetical protein